MDFFRLQNFSKGITFVTCLLFLATAAVGETNRSFPSSVPSDSSNDCVKVQLKIKAEQKLRADSELSVKITNSCENEVYFYRYSAPRFHIEKKGFDKKDRVYGDQFRGLPKDIPWSDEKSKERFLVPSKDEVEFRIKFSEILWQSPMSSIINWHQHDKVLEKTEYLFFVSVWGGTIDSTGEDKDVRASSEKFEFSYPFTKYRK